MVMVVLGGPIVEIEGKVGGNIWRVDQCGQHVQAAPRSLEQGATPAQRRRRNAFKKCLNYIRRYSSKYFVDTWQMYANQHPRTTSKGRTYTLAWWQMFISYNLNPVVAGKEIRHFPPGYGPEP